MQNLILKSKDIFIKIKNSFEVLLLGIIIGIVGCGICYYKVVIKENPVDQSTVSVNTISGIPLTIKKIFTKNKQTTIDTSYNGTGESTITIPNNSIPSARKWDQDHWLAGGFVSTDKAIYLGGGYRYDRFMLVGGPWFRNNNGYSGGVWIGGFVNF